jgi:hypothetical protein
MALPMRSRIFLFEHSFSKSHSLCHSRAGHELIIEKTMTMMQKPLHFHCIAANIKPSSAADSLKMN